MLLCSFFPEYMHNLLQCGLPNVRVSLIDLKSGHYEHLIRECNEACGILWACSTDVGKLPRSGHSRYARAWRAFMLSRASILSQRRLQELPAQLRRLVLFFSLSVAVVQKRPLNMSLSFCVILWTFPTKTESADFKNKDKTSTPGDVQDGLRFKFDMLFCAGQAYPQGNRKLRCLWWLRKCFAAWTRKWGPESQGINGWIADIPTVCHCQENKTGKIWKKQVINGSHIDSDGDKEAIKKQSYCNRM